MGSIIIDDKTFASSDITIPVPSATTQSLIALSQDITALLSLSIETTASIVYDAYRKAIGAIGLGEVVAQRPTNCTGPGGEASRGLAVVVVGAGEATGHSLALHLAKSGYTVFALLPLPSPNSPPTSAALSSLLLTWSRIQKRVKHRFPNHPGAVVPIITDPEIDDLTNSHMDAATDIKAKNRYTHAGETVRAYCQDNALTLVAIVCASRTARRPMQRQLLTPAPSPPRGKGRVKFIDDIPTPPPETSLLPNPTSSFMVHLLRPLRQGALTMTDEQTLLSLYRASVIEAIAMVRELRDLLSASAIAGKGKSRVIFVNGNEGVDSELMVGSAADGQLHGAMQVVGTARSEAARLLRAELGAVGIDVCEVVVGPMCARSPSPGCHLRHSSDESSDSDKTRSQLIENVLKKGERGAVCATGSVIDSKEVVLAQRLALLSRIWAVDDALLFSAVKRAIEDRYPRYRHHAGISPFISSIAEFTPGAAGFVKTLGRWVLGRLLRPRN